MERPLQEQTGRRRVQRTFVSSTRAHQFVYAVTSFITMRPATVVSTLCPTVSLFKNARFLDSRVEDRDHALQASPLRRTTLQKYSAGQITGKWVFAKVFAESPSSSKTRSQKGLYGYSKYELEEEKHTSEFKLSLVCLGCATTSHKTTRQALQVETIHVQACASPSLVSPTQRPKEPAMYVIDNNHVV